MGDGAADSTGESKPRVQVKTLGGSGSLNLLGHCEIKKKG